MKPDAGVRGREVLVVLPRAALLIRTFTNDTYQTTVKKFKFPKIKIPYCTLVGQGV